MEVGSAVKATPIPPGEEEVSSPPKQVHLSELTHDELQLLASNKSHAAFNATWHAKILLPLHPFYKGDNVDSISQDPPLTDLSSFLNDLGDLGLQKLYLSRNLYPPISDEDLKMMKKDRKKENEKLAAVDSLIKSAAKKSGSIVVIGDSSLKQVGGFYRDYVCGYCNANSSRRNVPPAAAEDGIGEVASSIPDNKYRESHLVNNANGSARRNAGRGAKGHARRRNKVLRGKPCQFRFRLKVDEYGFYISTYNGGGSTLHEGHPKFDPNFVPTQLSALTQEERSDAQHALNAIPNTAAAQRFVREKFNTHLSRAQLTYLNSLASEDNGDEFSSLAEMFDESEKIVYHMLESVNKEVLCSTKISGEVTQTQLADSAFRNELLPVAENALHQRCSRGIDHKKHVFHSIAWTHQDMLRYFLLCPEVVTFDVTSHTNRSGYHHLSFSCRTSIDKQVLFCRVWIPDQRRVSFRYVFMEALIKILPSHVRSRVRFLMCDGDPQQNIEIRLALKNLFPNATVGECAYHIVNMGWNRHVCNASFVSKKKRKIDTWMGFTKRIHAWLYSFTRPEYCVTAEEYEISKYLLIACLTSKHALKMAGGNELLIASAVSFVRDYIFPKEQNFLFHLRKKIFSLDVMCSSAQEGLHNGLKVSVAGVKATMALDTAAAAINIQDETRVAQLDAIVGSDFRNRCKRSWSPTSPTAPFLLTYAEALVIYSHKMAQQFMVRRIGPTLFQVVYVGKDCDPNFVLRYIEDWSAETGGRATAGESDVTADQEEQGNQDDAFSKFFLPLFNRAHVVDLNRTCSTCDCFHFQRAGFACPHMNACADAVCGFSGVKFEGFQHDSVSVRWWCDYMYWAYRTADSLEEEELVKLYHHLVHNDVKGPKFHYSIPSCMPIKECVADLPALERIKNYPKDLLAPLFKDFENKFDGIMSKASAPSSSAKLEETLEDDTILIESIGDVRGTCGEGFEKMMDAAHAAHDVETAVTGASSYRSAFYPLFNEYTDLLQQANDAELAREGEDGFKALIESVQKHLAEMSLNSTSPVEAGNCSGKKREAFTSITNARHTGQPRVKVARNSRH